jgi:hypothetical protein
MSDYTIGSRLITMLRSWFLPFTASNMGTYTPTYTGGTTAGTTTYSNQEGRWVRLGPVVYVWGRVNWSAATGTGNARISLPFTIAAGLTRNPVTVFTNLVTFANTTLQGMMLGTVNYFELYSHNTNAAVAAVQIEAAGEIAFAAMYPIE